MVKRIIMGRHPGINDTGVFVSHPGVSVDDVSVPFLLDSRWKGLDLLTHGRRQLSYIQSGSPTSSGQAVYYTSVGVPNLGYIPQFYGNVIYGSGNSLGIPVNTSYWPDAGISYAENRGSNYAVQCSGVWMPNAGTICCQHNVSPRGTSGTMYFYYIIFRNPQETS
jgi:hypothetical protein